MKALKVFILLGVLALAACVPEDVIRKLDLEKGLQLGQQAFGEVNQQQEVQIGDEAVAVLLGAAPLHPDTALQGYVNRVGRWVAMQSERPELPWKFAVIDTPSINAFAAPGGYVLITSGLMRQLGSEAELAGIIGHEIAHVLQKHYLQAVQKTARLDLASMLLSTQASEREQQNLQRISSGFREVYARGLDRQDEYQADRIGVILAARAGYDPYGLPAVLQTLAGMNPAASDLSLLYKTHPSPTQRLEQLEALYPKLDPYAAQANLATRYQQHTRGLRN